MCANQAVLSWTFIWTCIVIAAWNSGSGSNVAMSATRNSTRSRNPALAVRSRAA